MLKKSEAYQDLYKPFHRYLEYLYWKKKYKISLFHSFFMFIVISVLPPAHSAHLKVFESLKYKVLGYVNSTNMNHVNFLVKFY